MFGFSQEREMNTPWNETFELVADWGEMSYYFSKNTYEHEEGEEYDCKYKYVIEATIYGEETPYVSYVLMLMPLPEYWGEKCWEDVAEMTGCEFDEVKKRAEVNPNDVMLDLLTYGKCVNIGGQGCMYTEEPESWDAAEVKDEVLNAIAEVVPFIDRMRGFYLDRYVNRIGETGWDQLLEILKDVSGTEAALSRWEEGNAKSE